MSTTPAVAPAAKPVPGSAGVPVHNVAACAGMADDLGWSLGVVFREVLKTANAAAADVPGGQRGYQVLVATADGGPGTQLALAQQLGVDRTVMTYLLDDLEAAGLIERQPDPADRRARRVVITAGGRTVLAALQLRMAQIADHVLAALDPAEQQVFRSALNRVASGLAASDTVPSACTVVEEIVAADPVLAGSDVARPEAPAARRRRRG